MDLAGLGAFELYWGWWTSSAGVRGRDKRLAWGQDKYLLKVPSCIVNAKNGRYRARRYFHAAIGISTSFKGSVYDALSAGSCLVAVMRNRPLSL